jgi:hypothetical protein
LPFQTDDIAYLVGTSDAIRRAVPLFDALDESALLEP